MVIKLITYLAITTMLTGCNESNSPMYLLVRGQSNAVGMPERPVLTQYQADENIQAWIRGQWITASPDHVTTPRKLKRLGAYSFGLSAAKSLRKHCGCPVRIIVSAYPGVKYDLWLNGKRHWKAEIDLISRSGASNVYVLSHQGEAHHEESAEIFSQKVQAYEKQLEGQDWYSGIIVHGELLRGSPKSGQNAQIQSFKYVASSEGLTGIDDVHFDSKSLDILGQRYAERLIEAIDAK